MQNIYVAHSKFKPELIHEIGEKNVTNEYGNYVLSDKILKNSIWAQDIWFDVKKIEFDSISEAAKELKTMHSHWAGDSVSSHRRAQLIQEKINFYKHPRLEFLGTMPKINFGCWLMVDEKTIYASSNRRAHIPFGKIEFQENKTFPPSRAYLKLWEVFTVYGIKPQKNEVSLDLGSCPGGWSWVLSEVSKSVISVDKAPLDAKISKIKNIEFVKKDAFKLLPSDIPRIDWLFSDIICEPARLYDLVMLWKESGVKNFVCTIKFKGKTDFQILEKVGEIKNSQIVHLYNNKHEVTWILKE
jgi:23S rRNA (cytidine2498-2'-O)-methyltransferase